VKRKLNILLLIPELGFGGAQKSISNLSIEFAKNHNVYLCVFNNDLGIAFPFAGEILELDVKGGKNFLQKGLFFWKRITQLKKFKKKHKIDLTLSFLEGADYINILSRIKNEKIIISIRGSKSGDKEIKGFLGWIRRRILMNNLYRKADRIVAVSEGIRKDLIENYKIKKDKIITIYNFYAINELVERSRERLDNKHLPIFEHKNILINFGRLHVQKNFLALIEIFSLLKKDGVDSKLVIIGDGLQKDALFEYAHNKGLNISSWEDKEIRYDADVFFLGYDANPLKFIPHSTIFTFTSSWEGFPNSLAEAMTVGIPVMAADCPTGPREILAPSTIMNNNPIKKSEFAEYGILMPMLIEPEKDERIKEWAKVIKDLLANESLRDSLKQKAQERAQYFDKVNLIAQWLELIETLVSNKK
jgi:glycosyltransferase involved in cell wall biosynthesis